MIANNEREKVHERCRDIIGEKRNKQCRGTRWWEMDTEGTWRKCREDKQVKP